MYSMKCYNHFHFLEGEKRSYHYITFLFNLCLWKHFDNWYTPQTAFWSQHSRT